MPSTIALAHARFPNLRADGILRRSATGPLIDTADIEAALAFLGRCRRNKRPNVHTLDLQHHVSRWAGRPISVGAIITAAVSLNFEVRGWYGVRAFYPHAMLNVNQRDIRKLDRQKKWPQHELWTQSRRFRHRDVRRSSRQEIAGNE
jgi:hypothetical protein